jgi:membrane protein DedA with SNARE-associated domain
VIVVHGFTELLTTWIADQGGPFGFLLIAGSAMIEYLFPPFPGDTVTLFAAILITAYGWSFFGVFGAVMAGSLLGSLLAFYLGRWLRTRRARRLAARADDAASTEAGEAAAADEAPGAPPEESAALDRLVAGFRRHGAAYLVLNRFLPGVRSLFFVAAGMADMRPLPVLVYSAVSAAAWNLAIIALGSALGANFDTLVAWVERYTTVVWVVIAVAVTIWVWRLLRSRRRS